MKRVLFVAIAALAAGQAMAVNKCTIGGKVVYQEAACPGSGGTVAEDIQRRTTERAKQLSADERADAERKARVDAMVQRINDEREQRLSEARASCGSLAPAPTIGMPEQEFLRCTEFGVTTPPDKVNVTERATGIKKQFVYRGEYSRIRYVYTEDGVVTTIQR